MRIITPVGKEKYTFKLLQNNPLYPKIMAQNKTKQKTTN